MAGTGGDMEEIPDDFDFEDEGFKFKSVEPEPIPGVEKPPTLDFVPIGMEEPVIEEPTPEDLRPLREVEISPVQYLKRKDELSLFLSRLRFRLQKLPFSNTSIFFLQLTAITALYMTVALNFYINPPESGFLGTIGGISEFFIWGSAAGGSLISIIFGTLTGGGFAYLKGINMHKKNMFSAYAMRVIASLIVFISFFFIIVPVFHIKFLDFNNLDIFMNYIIIPTAYLMFLLIFSAAVIFGVYGLLTGQMGSVSLSSAIIFLQVTLSLNSFALTTSNLSEVFLTSPSELFIEEGKITLFSLSYLAYVELSFAVSRFTENWKRTSRYDHRTGEDMFTRLLGHTVNLYIVFFAGILLATYFMMVVAIHMDDLFGIFLTPAMADSVEHSTVQGKVLFVLLFFGLIGLIKGFVPAKEYIKGKMNVTSEEIENPMTIVEMEEEQR